MPGTLKTTQDQKTQQHDLENLDDLKRTRGRRCPPNGDSIRRSRREAPRARCNSPTVGYAALLLHSSTNTCKLSYSQVKLHRRFGCKFNSVSKCQFGTNTHMCVALVKWPQNRKSSRAKWRQAGLLLSSHRLCGNQCAVRTCL